MQTYYKQRGVGLLEVLIAVLILSVSLLAIASLQTRSLQYNQSAYVRSQINILAYDIFDRIRANRTNIDNYALDAGDEASAGTDRASVDTREWLESIQRVWPNATASLECTLIAGTNVHKCTASVSWDERTYILRDDEPSEDEDADMRPTFTYTTSI